MWILALSAITWLIKMFFLSIISVRLTALICCSMQKKHPRIWHLLSWMTFLTFSVIMCAHHICISVLMTSSLIIRFRLLDCLSCISSFTQKTEHFIHKMNFKRKAMWYFFLCWSTNYCIISSNIYRNHLRKIFNSEINEGIISVVLFIPPFCCCLGHQ